MSSLFAYVFTGLRAPVSIAHAEIVKAFAATQTINKHINHHTNDSASVESFSIIKTSCYPGPVEEQASMHNNQPSNAYPSKP